MKNFLLLVALILSFAFDNAFAAAVTDDATTNTICKIVGYTHGIGGPMITIVIIGAAFCNIWQNAMASAFCTWCIYCCVFWCTCSCFKNSTRWCDL
ncbi:TrbC/VirB2 family protein [Wolbachia pipientis]|uniref:TrbC/VirB2 family protein n=1 Tax=Wolbachia pipientis TaxID=955 RepID=UPI0002403EFC|nr:hypothetical protein DEJ70_02295 [Wolbachia pipientis wAlbB]QDW08472.1 hypothetical protein CO539_002285 [Wolbachia pipientis]THA20064.1 hypothetical protein EJE47_03365 [Wolbachia endosymbiont of Aedes albopictus]QDW09662.1 hypothetical protein CO538_002285 [Wolbachia pipientis]QZA83861.1 TrbC/VirB2 family protein [Wolbachia pipientis]